MENIKINFNKKPLLLCKHHIVNVFNEAMLELKIKTNTSVNITFVSNEEINELNNQFRKVDKVTDVLSFPLVDFAKGEKLLDNELNDLGDIVICVAVAKKQAKEYKHSFKREICFLALHGLLHLLGYDHIEKQDEEIMFALQKNILGKAGIKRNV